jgi:protein phosphatase
MANSMEFVVGARTDVGQRRANNEDAFALVPQINLFVLSDGMGGQAAGEVASKLAVETISGCLRDAAGGGQKVAYGDPNPNVSEATNELASAIRLSNRAIRDTAKKHLSHKDMGATVVTAWISGQIMSIAHVGDSRIYMLRHGEMQQLTEDHSLVMEQVRRGLITREQAEQSDMQNIIVRALGAEDTVEVDVDEVFLMPGDYVVLCSDGLTKMLPDQGIAEIVLDASSPQEAADRLIDAANEKGGEDNVTVIVVQVKVAKPKGLWALFRVLFIGG